MSDTSMDSRARAGSYERCRFIQNSGVLPNKVESRSAVSTIRAVSPFTSRSMRVRGTREAATPAAHEIAT